MKNKILQLTVCIFFFLGCEERSIDSRLIIENNSGDRIACFLSKEYPDTSLVNIGFLNRPYENNIVNPKNKLKWKIVNNTWENIFENEIKSDTLCIFILSPEFYDIPQDRLDKMYPLLKSYYLSYNDLERNNWTITYKNEKNNNN